MADLEIQYDYSHDLFYLGRDGKTIIAIGSDAFHDLFGQQWHWEAKHRPAGASKVVWIPFQGEPHPLKEGPDYPFWQEDRNARR